MQIARALINMTWKSGAKCKIKRRSLPSGVVSGFQGGERGGGGGEEEGDGVIKSSGTLSLPGLGWLPVNRRGQSGFIGYV